VKNRDFVEKKPMIAKNHFFPLLMLIKVNFESIESVLRMYGQKTSLLCDSDHEVIGIAAVCPRVFSITGISFSFFE
jgi:hypothetical protein